MSYEQVVKYIQKKASLTFILIAFLIYLNTLPNEFVLDDKIQIAGNPNIHSLSNIPKFFLGSTFTDQSGELQGNYYKPLLTSAFAILYALFGNWTAPYHLVQISIHAINTILVYKVLLKFFTEKKSLFGAVLFLVHPINAEAVVYISNLQDVLYFLFGILAIYVYLYKPNTTKNAIQLYILLLLSLLSKETGILFWALLWIYQMLHQKKHLLTTTIILVCMFVIYAIIRIQVANIDSNSIKFSTIMKQPLERRVLHIPAIYSYYLQTFFVPYNLVVNQNWVISKLTLVNFYGPLALAIISISAYILLWKKTKNDTIIRKTLTFFGCWYAIGILLHMQLYPLDATVSTRWFYFPFLGLIGILLVAYTHIFEQKKIQQKIIYTTATTIIIIYAITSFLRTFDWRTEGTLAARDTKIDKHNFVLEVAYGLDYLNNQKYEQAEKHFKRAIEIDGKNNMAWHNLGYLYELRGFNEDKNYYTQSEYYYKKALEIGNDATTYINLASLMLFKQQRPYQEVYEFLEKAIQAHPKVPKLLIMQALVLQKLGDDKNAKMYASAAMKISPNEPLYAQVYYWIQSGQDIKLEP